MKHKSANHDKIPSHWLQVTSCLKRTRKKKKLNGRKRQTTGRIPGSRLSSKAILYTTQGIKTELLIALDSAHRGFNFCTMVPHHRPSSNRNPQEVQADEIPTYALTGSGLITMVTMPVSWLYWLS